MVNPEHIALKYYRDYHSGSAKTLKSIQITLAARLEKFNLEMTTPLFLLRSVEIGISISDLNLLTVGLVIDMWTEKANDGVKYKKIATQQDFDKF